MVQISRTLGDESRRRRSLLSARSGSGKELGLTGAALGAALLVGAAGAAVHAATVARSTETKARTRMLGWKGRMARRRIRPTQRALQACCALCARGHGPGGAVFVRPTNLADRVGLYGTYSSEIGTPSAARIAAMTALYSRTISLSDISASSL
jgi:hypothetical protein